MAGPIRIAILADARRAVRGMRDVGDGAVKMGRRVEGVNARLALGFETLGTAFVALGLVDGFKELVKQGAKLTNAMQGTQQVFGKSASGVLEWSKTTAASLGVSRAEALEATKQFGGFFTAVGFGARKAAEMSESWTVLAANLAAFGDLPTADALDSITSALRGELDPLQKYIPTITAAAIQHKALALSGKKSASALTAADKAAALNALMMESVANKAGAAERGQHGFNTELGKVKAQAKDAAGNLGKILLPVLSDILDFINKKMIPALDTLIDKLGPKLSVAIDKLRNFKSQKIVIDVTSSGSVDRIVENFKKGARSLPPVFSTAVAKLTPIFDRIGQTLGAAFDKARPQIRDIFASIASIVSSAFGIIRGLVTDGTAVIQAIWRSFGGVIQDYISGAFAGVVTIIQGFFTTVSGIFGTLSAVLNGDWQAAWDSMEKIARGGLQSILGVLQWSDALAMAIFDGMGTIVEMSQEKLKAAWEAIVSWAVGKWHEFTDAIDAGTLPLVNSISTKWEMIRANTMAVWGSIQASVSGRLAAIRATVSGAVGTVRANVSAAWGSVLSRTVAAWSAVRAAVSAALAGVRAAVIAGINNVVGAVRSLPGRLQGALSGASGWLYSVGVNAVQGMISGIGSMVDSLTAKARSLASSAISAAKGALGISSPSKEFEKIGKFVGVGFILGLTGTTSKIQSTMDKLTRLVTDAFKGRTKSAWLARIKTDNAVLLKLAKQRDVIADQIKAAQSKLSDLVKAKAGVVANIRDSFSQSFTLVDQAAQEGDTSIRSILDRSAAAVKQAALFAGQLGELRKRGLSSAVLQELAAAGPEAGAATARALAGASQQQLAELNDNYKSIAQSGTAAGNVIASSMFDAGIKSTEALIKGLRSRQAAIDAEMKRIAARLRAGLSAAVNVKVPVTKTAAGKATSKAVSGLNAAGLAPINITVNTGAVVDKRGLVDAVSDAINEVAAQLGRPIRMAVEVV